MGVYEIFRVYEPLHDLSDNIARQNGIDISAYAGRAAFILNQASEAGIASGSCLIGPLGDYALPRLSSIYNLPAGTEESQLYLDVNFAELEHLHQFKTYAIEQTYDAWSERMNRALRLANFIAQRAGVGESVILHNTRTDSKVHTIL